MKIFLQYICKFAEQFFLHLFHFAALHFYSGLLKQRTLLQSFDKPFMLRGTSLESINICCHFFYFSTHSCLYLFSFATNFFLYFFHFVTHFPFHIFHLPTEYVQLSIYLFHLSRKLPNCLKQLFLTDTLQLRLCIHYFSLQLKRRKLLKSRETPFHFNVHGAILASISACCLSSQSDNSISNLRP